MLLSGAGIWLYTVTSKVSRTELMDLLSKREDIIEKKIEHIVTDFKKGDEILDAKIDKEREESERLIRSELNILKQQIEFIVSGIKDIKEKI